MSNSNLKSRTGGNPSKSFFAAFPRAFQRMRSRWPSTQGDGQQPRANRPDGKLTEGHHRFGGDGFSPKNEKEGASSPSDSFPRMICPIPTGFDCSWPYPDPQFHGRGASGGSDAPAAQSLKSSDRKHNLRYAFGRRLRGLRFRRENPFRRSRTRARKRDPAYEPARLARRYRETASNVGKKP